MHVLKRRMDITLRFNSEPVPQVLAAGHYVGGGGVRVCVCVRVCRGGVSAREVHSVLVLLWWWSGQQLACLSESSNVRSSPLREDEGPAVHSFPSLYPSLLPSIPPSFPPRCRFYELPWALIHLCHTQAPLLGLLTNWLGCRWEGPAGHIWFLQAGQRPASQTTKICGNLGVDKPMSSECL